MPPSTKRGWIAAISAARIGEIAFASTYTPSKPSTARATSSAACGGQIERISSASAASRSTVTASRNVAARVRVASLRPSDAHSTSCPFACNTRPTAAPISPG